MIIKNTFWHKKIWEMQVDNEKIIYAIFIL